jgi:hypothetical protein
MYLGIVAGSSVVKAASSGALSGGEIGPVCHAVAASPPKPATMAISRPRAVRRGDGLPDIVDAEGGHWSDEAALEQVVVARAHDPPSVRIATFLVRT